MGGAYPKNNRRALEIMLKYPNAYMDTASSMHEGTIERTIEAVGSKRLLFGSDFPVLDFEEQYLVVAKAKIADKEKQDILLNNAFRLFGIKP